MSQFRLGRARRPREVFEPTTFGFHSHATRETAVWAQALSWTLERSTSLTQDDRSSLHRFLRDFQQSEGAIIIMIEKPLQLVLLGRQWRPGQSPKLKLPVALGAVARALQSLCERPRLGSKTNIGSNEPAPLRTDLGAHKRGDKQKITYTPGVRK